MFADLSFSSFLSRYLGGISRCICEQKPAVDVLIVFDRSRSSYAVTEPPGGCAGEPQCIGGTKKLFDVLKTTKDLVVEELVAMFSSDGVAPFLETRDIRFAAASFSSDVTVDFDFDADLSHLQTVGKGREA